MFTVWWWVVSWVILRDNWVRLAPIYPGGLYMYGWHVGRSANIRSNLKSSRGLLLPYVPVATWNLMALLWPYKTAGSSIWLPTTTCCEKGKPSLINRQARSFELMPIQWIYESQYTKTHTFYSILQVVKFKRPKIKIMKSALTFYMTTESRR